MSPKLLKGCYEGEMSEDYCLMSELTANHIYCCGRNTRMWLYQPQSTNICCYTSTARSEERSCPMGDEEQTSSRNSQSHLIITRAERRAHGGEGSL